MILSHERVQIHMSKNLCSYATKSPHFRVRELLQCGILVMRAGDGRWPRYQAKSLACPGGVLGRVSPFGDPTFSDLGLADSSDPTFF